MSGASGRTVIQKLGIKPGFCILTAGAPGAYADIVGALPEGVTIVHEPKAPLDMAHVFAMQAAGLEDLLRSCRAAIKPDGMIWVSWPKKASAIATELTDVAIRQTALPLGLVDIKVCAIDNIWSGLKFVVPTERRAKPVRRVQVAT